MAYFSDLDIEIKEKQKFNGWSNYATWRINLEMFDGFKTQDYYDDYKDAYEFSDFLKQYADELLFTDSGTWGLVHDYAQAFLNEVNWYEIAEHLLTAEKENIKYYEDNQNETA
jgi:hypothetical protein